jgi:predicted RNase H-like HicB family nuclease
MARKRPVLGEKRIGGVLRVEQRGRELQVTGTLTGFVFREGDAWVAYCQGLDLSSCGETEEAALAAVTEAINLWVWSCIERGTLEQALGEMGWVCQEPSGEIADCRLRKLPPAFMIEKMRRNGKDWSRPIRFGK